MNPSETQLTQTNQSANAIGQLIAQQVADQLSENGAEQIQLNILIQVDSSPRKIDGSTATVIEPPVEPLEIGAADMKRPLPRWVMPFAYWVRIGLAIFLILSGIVGLTGCSPSNGEWKQATQIVPEAVLQQVLTENTSVDPATSSTLIAQMKAWNVPVKEGKLAVIDYNTPDLCGQSGCLFSGVWTKEGQPAKIVLSTYLDRRLPQGKKLFELVEKDSSIQGQSALPCLKINQLADENLLLTFCFDGQVYKAVQGTVIGSPTVKNKDKGKDDQKVNPTDRPSPAPN